MASARHVRVRERHGAKGEEAIEGRMTERCRACEECASASAFEGRGSGRREGRAFASLLRVDRTVKTSQIARPRRSTRVTRSSADTTANSRFLATQCRSLGHGRRKREPRKLSEMLIQDEHLGSRGLDQPAMPGRRSAEERGARMASATSSARRASVTRWMSWSCTTAVYRSSWRSSVDAEMPSTSSRSDDAIGVTASKSGPTPSTTCPLVVSMARKE
jgi:hypothetical protein